MTRYSSFEQLNGKTLTAGDVVIIRGLIYTVESSYARCRAFSNSHIFEKLKQDPHRFTSAMYGYENRGGAWPTCRYYDYEALTRCMLALYAIGKGWEYITFGKKVISLNHRPVKPEVIPVAMRISSWDVRIHADHLQVGCTDFPYKKIQVLFNKLKKEKYIK